MTNTPFTLLLLPGLDGTGLLFEPFIEALGSDCRVITVRYPTTSASPSHQSHAALLAHAVSALPPEGSGPVIVLGESFSGPIAVMLAAAHPRRVAGVVMCCTFVRNPRPALHWLAGLTSLPLPLPPQPLIDAVLLGRFATPRLSQLLHEALSQVPTAVLRARAHAVMEIDVREQADAVRVPVLYLQAGTDLLVPAAASAEALQAFRDAALESFDAPHCLLQTVPQQAAEAVKSFAAKVVAKAR